MKYTVQYLGSIRNGMTLTEARDYIADKVGKFDLDKIIIPLGEIAYLIGQAKVELEYNSCFLFITARLDDWDDISHRRNGFFNLTGFEDVHG